MEYRQITTSQMFWFWVPIQSASITDCIWLNALPISTSFLNENLLPPDANKKSSKWGQRWIEKYRDVYNPHSDTTLIVGASKKFTLMNIKIWQSWPSHIHSIMASYWFPREYLHNKIVNRHILWPVIFIKDSKSLPSNFHAIHRVGPSRQD